CASYYSNYNYAMDYW
nr:immunoglobulin heavy chain junction region [Mus musculus]NSM04009.1 immunoglobulin heavy chain junction region [Mus musculus]NSM04226.1 immunoglobulin heavy chain junction region [Mus musculus]NSM04246.1 immunoglobulin heavy chain junction region [Mus musculus]NSM05272.1 immunoglobulin heavy chain junction region [Mus musculus]